MSIVTVVSETQSLVVGPEDQSILVNPIPEQTVIIPQTQSIVVNPISNQPVILVGPISTISISTNVQNSLLVLPRLPSVSVVHSGPIGPAGASSTPNNLAQAAFHDAAGLESKTIEYVGGLPSVIKYYENSVFLYESTITYTNDLPTLITLVDQLSNQEFIKEITYSTGLPVSVEWSVV